MERLHESRVDPADIDNLGHMNVRVYARKAAEATRSLAGLLGITGDHTQIFDSHVHFRREQLEGAPLLIHGGVAEASQDTITAYLEMTNADNGDLAATFLNVFRVIDPATRNGQVLPDSALEASGAHRIAVPNHGKPRSLPLDPLRTDLSLDRLEQAGVMQRVEPYEVLPEDCDAHGFMDLSDSTHLPFAKMPIKFPRQGNHGSKSNGNWSDLRVAIATMESRQFLFANPKLGDTVVTKTIHAHVGEKSLTFNHWSFNRDTGEPFGMLAQFGLGFDLDIRRSVPFPDDMRKGLEEHLHPDFSDALAKQA